MGMVITFNLYVHGIHDRVAVGRNQPKAEKRRKFENNQPSPMAFPSLGFLLPDVPKTR